MRKIGLLFCFFAFLLVGCETDSYEKGTGKYSLMLADMAELTVDADHYVVSFTTDDSDAYRLAYAVTTAWIQTADTTYRSVVYYNKEESGMAEVLGLTAVPTLLPKEHWRYEKQPSDPVGFESAWMAKSGKYLNLGLLFKTGRVDDTEGQHSIGVAQDTVLVNADQTRTAYYRFLHDQGDTPQYYTNRHYVSILLPDDRPDSIRLSITTYDGVVERLFAL